jgi:hypothetical protein
VLIQVEKGVDTTVGNVLDKGVTPEPEVKARREGGTPLLVLFCIPTSNGVPYVPPRVPYSPPVPYG